MCISQAMHVSYNKVIHLTLENFGPLFFPFVRQLLSVGRQEGSDENWQRRCSKVGATTYTNLPVAL